MLCFEIPPSTANDANAHSGWSREGLILRGAYVRQGRRVLNAYVAAT